MEGVSSAINALDKKLQAAIKIYDKVRLKLHQEQDFVNWFHKHFFGFKSAYLNKGKPLDAQIEKCVACITLESDTADVISVDLPNLMDQIVEIKKKLWDITEKHTSFYETSLLDKQRNLHVYQIFSDHSVRLWEALQARSKTNPPLSEEEIESLEVPDFLWELNNLYPHSQSIMDEYNSDVFASKVEQLAIEFKECTKYFSKKRPRPDDSDAENDETYISEHNEYYGSSEDVDFSNVSSVTKPTSIKIVDSADPSEYHDDLAEREQADETESDEDCKSTTIDSQEQSDVSDEDV